MRFYDLVNFPAVGEFDGGAGGVDEEFFEEVLGDVLGLTEGECFEAGDVLEGGAVGELVAGVDRLAGGPGFFGFEGAVVFAPAADDVKIF